MSALVSRSGSFAGLVRPTPATLLILLALATLAVRLAVGALAPLTEDEAYYRLWSLRPAFGYFDHPPMIAWWIWLGRKIAGDGALGVRLLPILAASATTVVTFGLARLSGLGSRPALRAAVWLNATGLVGLGGGLAVPDAPTSLLWTTTLCFGFLAMRGRGAWWLAAGAAAGLACLSKYSALFLAPGVLLWLAAAPAGRRQLAGPWPWLAALVALAVFAPNIAWNADHRWMTFAKQFGRVAAGGFNPRYLAALVIDQALLLNPLIAVFVGLAVRRRAALPLLLTSAPFAAYLVIHSLHAAVQGQWPAPLYPSLAIAAAGAAEGAGGRLARLRAAAAPLGFAVSAAAFAFVLAPVGARLPFRDPAADFRGWPGFSARVEAAREGAGAAWVGAPSYGLAAQLAASPALHAPSIELYERERYTFEAPAETADLARPGLVVVPARDAGGPALRSCFADVRPLPEIDRGRGASLTPYAAYQVSDPRRDVERQGCGRRAQPNR